MTKFEKHLLGDEDLPGWLRTLIMRHAVLIYGASRRLKGSGKTLGSDWWLIAVGGTRRYLHVPQCKLRTSVPRGPVYCYRNRSGEDKRDPRRLRVFRWQVLLVADPLTWSEDLLSQEADGLHHQNGRPKGTTALAGAGEDVMSGQDVDSLFAQAEEDLDSMFQGVSAISRPAFPACAIGKATHGTDGGQTQASIPSQAETNSFAASTLVSQPGGHNEALAGVPAPLPYSGSLDQAPLDNGQDAVAKAKKLLAAAPLNSKRRHARHASNGLRPSTPPAARGESAEPESSSGICASSEEVAAVGSAVIGQLIADAECALDDLFGNEVPCVQEEAQLPGTDGETSNAEPKSRHEAEHVDQVQESVLEALEVNHDQQQFLDNADASIITGVLPREIPAESMRKELPGSAALQPPGQDELEAGTASRAADEDDEACGSTEVISKIESLEGSAPQEACEEMMEDERSSQSRELHQGEEGHPGEDTQRLEHPEQIVTAKGQWTESRLMLLAAAVLLIAFLMEAFRTFER